MALRHVYDEPPCLTSKTRLWRAQTCMVLDLLVSGSKRALYARAQMSLTEPPTWVPEFRAAHKLHLLRQQAGRRRRSRPRSAPVSLGTGPGRGTPFATSNGSGLMASVTLSLAWAARLWRVISMSAGVVAPYFI